MQFIRSFDEQGGPINVAGGYSSDGDITGFIIYLQNGNQCGANGENCLIRSYFNNILVLYVLQLKIHCRDSRRHTKQWLLER